MLTLSFQKVWRAFGARTVFRDFDAAAGSGRVTAVTGANGAGKSTLLRLAGAWLLPDRGTVAIREGQQSWEREQIRQRVALVSPELCFYGKLSAAENLAFFAGLRGQPLAAAAAEALVQRVGLAAADGWVEGFSTGMRQRLKLAVLLAADAPVWLLDEPASNLDAAGQALVLELAAAAAREGRLVLWATNDPEEAAAADETIRLS